MLADQPCIAYMAPTLTKAWAWALPLRMGFHPQWPTGWHWEEPKNQGILCPHLGTGILSFSPHRLVCIELIGPKEKVPKLTLEAPSFNSCKTSPFGTCSYPCSSLQLLCLWHCNHKNQTNTPHAAVLINTISIFFSKRHHKHF